jgi:hypothetical protein
MKNPQSPQKMRKTTIKRTTKTTMSKTPTGKRKAEAKTEFDDANLAAAANEEELDEDDEDAEELAGKGKKSKKSKKSKKYYKRKAGSTTRKTRLCLLKLSTVTALLCVWRRVGPTFLFSKIGNTSQGINDMNGSIEVEMA